MKKVTMLLVCFLAFVAAPVTATEIDRGDGPDSDPLATCEAQLHALYDVIDQHRLWEIIDFPIVIILEDDPRHELAHQLEHTPFDPDQATIFHNVADPGMGNCHNWKEVTCRVCTSWADMPGWPYPQCQSWETRKCGIHGSHCW